MKNKKDRLEKLLKTLDEHERRRDLFFGKYRSYNNKCNNIEAKIQKILEDDIDTAGPITVGDKLLSISGGWNSRKLNIETFTKL